MKISFGDKKLAKAAKDEKVCYKQLGQRRGELYLRRLNDLYSAETLEDVRSLPGRYHELTGDRAGQWACDLDHPYRLIFTPSEFSVHNNDKHPARIEIIGVEIIEIVDYH